MDASIIKEQMVFCYALLTGAGIVAGYDVLRLLRFLIPHKKWAVDGEDILFWMCCFPVLFHLLYGQNTQNMRMYEIMGATSGMLIYEKCIHKNMSRLLTICVKKVKIILRRFLRGTHVGKKRGTQ